MMAAIRLATLILATALVAGTALAQEPASSPEDDSSPLGRLDELEKRNRDQARLLEEQGKRLRELEKRLPAPDQQPSPQEFVVGEDLKMSGRWQNGATWESADRAFRFTVGGRADFDNVWYSSSDALSNSVGQFNNFFDPNLGLTDGSAFRRARLRVQGQMWEVVDFVAELDFAQFIDLRRRTLGLSSSQSISATGNEFEPTAATIFNEVALGVNQIPVLGTVRAGHQRETLSFATGTSGRFLPFMERPLGFEAFNSDFLFGSGASVQRTFLDDRAYAFAGVFRSNSRSGGVVGDGAYAYDLRLTGLPVWDEACRTWVHVGVDYSYRNLYQGQTRFRARPLVRSGVGFEVPNILNTGTLFSPDAQQVFNLEYASAFGRFTLTAEAAWSWVTDVYLGGLPLAGRLPSGVRPTGNYQARAAYAEALCFLTPDHRGYRRDRPGYDRVVPRENFFLVRGKDGPLWGRGAWEVGARVDYLDLTDAGINGGTAHALTLGLNWYLNPNTAVHWNYVWMRREFEPPDNAGRRDGDLHGLGVRLHWDF